MSPVKGNGIKIVIVETISTFLSVIAVILRIWARRITKKELAINDWAAIGACFFNLCLAAAVYETATIGGLGQHLHELPDPPKQATILIKSLLAIETTWAMANSLVKISILHLYITIFRGKWFCIAAYTIMALSMCYDIAVLFEAVLLCRPLAYTWNKSIPNGNCGNTTRAYEAVGILNLLTDLAIIILPMPLLWSLNLPTAKKLALTAIFGVGVIICTISTIRVVTLASWNFDDLSFVMGRVAYTSMLEPTLGIINCCLPVLQPVLSKITSPRLWTRHSAPRNDPAYGKRSSGKGFPNQVNSLDGPFHRLPENSYPMGSVMSRTNQIYSEPSIDLVDRTSPARSDDEEALGSRGKILVKQEWTVNHY